MTHAAPHGKSISLAAGLILACARAHAGDWPGFPQGEAKGIVQQAQEAGKRMAASAEGPAPAVAAAQPQGVVQTATCGPAAMNGIGEVGLLRKDGDTFNMDLYSISNAKFCDQSRGMSYVVSLAYDFVFLGKPLLIELDLTDGAVAGIRELGKEDPNKYVYGKQGKLTDHRSKGGPHGHQK